MMIVGETRLYKSFSKNSLTSLSICDLLIKVIVFNPQIAPLHLCSQPTAIFIFGTAKFARSEFTIHCEHPGEPQINTCGFVFSSSFSNNQSSTSENTDDFIQ
ncbi:MAG TPA: hypothetical protein V6D43_02650 [Candidatus Sericytochromatia bacterium]